MTTNQLRKYIIGIFALMFIVRSSDAQTIGKIKEASDNHSQQSSSSSSGGSSNTRSSSSPQYSETNDDDYESDDGGAVLLLFDILSSVHQRRTQRMEERSDFQEAPAPVVFVPRKTIHDFDLRRSLDSRKVTITNAQYQIASNHYFGSFRYNSLTEPRAKDVDAFPTFEMQFIGFNTKTYPFNLAMATGFYSEIYSGLLYWEHLARIKWEFKKGITFNAEGRVAINKGVIVRSEGTLSAFATLKEWKKSALLFGAFFSSALYYETVPVENIGLNLRLNIKSQNQN